MRKISILLIILIVMATHSCRKEKAVYENPFFSEWETPFGMPPFDRIRPEHYKPAFERAIRLHEKEIDSIVNNMRSPDFGNTILALDNSGRMLATVYAVFSLICAADTNEQLQAVEEEISPVITAHYDNIFLNDRLFERVGAVYGALDYSGLDSLQRRLTVKTYDRFVRAGALLSPQGKDALRDINERLGTAGIKFGNNLLAAINEFKLATDSAGVEGLPHAARDAARKAAQEAGRNNKYVFTLKKPSMIPFLTHSSDRQLRRELYEAYLGLCNYDSPHDNRELVSEIVKLRDQKAKLIGYETFADFRFYDRMAKDPQAVYSLLDNLWGPALKRAGEEMEEMTGIMVDETGAFDLEGWDWWYYADKVRKKRYDLDEELLKVFFSLPNVRDGIFELCNRLYGITFRPLTDVPVYNSECWVYEALDNDDSHLGIVILDMHPREGKRGGAWSGSYRDRTYYDGVRLDPIVTIVCNFTRPSGSRPALLSIDETRTFFHEFGHALHTLMTDVPYRGLQDTELDFVELPSQIMENWAFEPRMLRRYAFHYSSNKPIGEDLIEKLSKSRYFNMGFATTELIAAAYTDMDIHTKGPVEAFEVNAFEAEAMNARGLMHQIAPRYRYPFFSHIFDGGYSAGYYSYIWSEVLDKDAFEAFAETGDIFDRRVAASFRKNILERGGSADGMAMYRNFRGREPSDDYLLYGRGLRERPPRVVDDYPFMADSTAVGMQADTIPGSEP